MEVTTEVTMEVMVITDMAKGLLNPLMLDIPMEVPPMLDAPFGDFLEDMDIMVEFCSFFDLFGNKSELLTFTDNIVYWST